MQALICDRCGAVIKGGDVDNAIKVDLSTKAAGGHFDTLHLCEDCYQSFTDGFLQDFEEEH
mgnify:CR=1 FL=1